MNLGGDTNIQSINFFYSLWLGPCSFILVLIKYLALVKKKKKTARKHGTELKNVDVLHFICPVALITFPMSKPKLACRVAPGPSSPDSIANHQTEKQSHWLDDCRWWRQRLASERLNKHCSSKPSPAADPQNFELNKWWPLEPLIYGVLLYGKS